MKSILAVCLSLVACIVHAGDVSDVKLSRRWQPLFVVMNSTPVQDLPEEYLVSSSIGGVKFEGPHSDVNLLGKFETNGVFVLGSGVVHRQVGNNALLQLPSAETFDLEGLVDVGDLGGMLILVGWNNQTNSGHAIYSVGMKSSGDPWRICRIENGKAVTGSDRLILKKKIRGEGAFRLKVEEKGGKYLLSLAHGDQVILMNLSLDKYKAGSVLIGSYAAGYGGKNLKFRSLRMRSR